MNPEYTESKMAAQKLDPEAEMDMLVAEVQRGDEELLHSRSENQMLQDENRTLRERLEQLELEQSPVTFPVAGATKTTIKKSTGEFSSPPLRETPERTSTSPLHFNNVRPSLNVEGPTRVAKEECPSAIWVPGRTSTGYRPIPHGRVLAGMELPHTEEVLEAVLPELQGHVGSQGFEVLHRTSNTPVAKQRRLQASSEKVTTSKPNIIPDRFDGRVPWGEYLSHFEACRMANGWDNEQSRIFLAASLRGPALKALGNKAGNSSSLSYQELIRILEKRFGPGQLAENYLLELRYRRQGPKESIQELGQAVGELSRLAYPELPDEAQERLARTHFLEAIEDQSVREGVFRSKPCTLDEAIQAALSTDNFYRLEEQRTGRRQKQARVVEGDAAKTSTELWEEIRKINEKLENQDKVTKERPGQWKRRSAAADDECFYCHEKGHFRRSCPKRRKREGNDKHSPGNEGQPTTRPEGRLDQGQGQSQTQRQ